MGNVAYIIPGVRKVIDQGPTIQETRPTPGIDNYAIRYAAYENVTQALRYKSGSPGHIHIVPAQQTFPPPIVDRVTPVQVNYSPFNTQPSSYISPVARYVHQGATVQQTIPIPIVDRVTSVLNNYSPFNTQPWSFASPIKIYLHQGPIIRDLYIPGIFNPQQPLPYRPDNRTKYVDVPVVIPDSTIYKIRTFQPYPIPYPIIIRNYGALVHYPPYVPQQTYIFPIKQPIQEYWTRERFKQHVKLPKTWQDNVVVISSGNTLLACVDISASWGSHFTTFGWTDIQDQITAGYPVYAQPAQTTGQYQEVFDFGSIISNIITIITFNEEPVVETVTTTSTTLETSTDAITWSAPTVGTSIFATSLRYVRVTMNFVGSSDKALAYYSNLQCMLNVHREQDGGQANVFAADVGGTIVSFNKAFKALDALTVTPIATTEQKAVYDFAFPPNPTTFKVLLFNAAGARINGSITWVARGIF